MHVHVDQARRDDQSLRVDLSNFGFRISDFGFGGDDLSIAEVDVADLIPLVCGVDYSSVANNHSAHSVEIPPHKNKTAMRTARPFVTWSRMTLCTPSATSLSISTPRLIGPGCMIKQSGFKSLARSLVRPNKRMYSPIPGKYSLRWRSCWMRNRFTTSACGNASSILCEISTPSFSNSRGTSVLGPTSVTRAPSLSRPKIFDRATRLNRMSPTIATRSPEMLPRFSRIV